jgi:hypothetical protein
MSIKCIGAFKLSVKCLYCLNPVLIYDEVFNTSNVYLCAQQYFIVLLYVNIIIITTNDLLVRHVSICVGHLQVTVKPNEVFGFLWCLLVSY